MKSVLDFVSEYYGFLIIVIILVIILVIGFIAVYKTLKSSGSFQVKDIQNFIQGLIGLNWGGGITLVAVIFTLWLTKDAIGQLITYSNAAEYAITLPLLIIAGVTVLVLVLAILTVAFRMLNLTDSSQALALPEGSIRAVISLALIVIFSILVTYLYSDISAQQKGVRNEIHNLTNEDAQAFIKNHPDISSINLLSDSISKDKFAIIYYTKGLQDNKESVDFAKQLLIMLGTLMSSLTGFYFASRTSSSETQNSSTPTVNPILRSIEPKQVKKSEKPEFNLKISGDNLNDVKYVKLINGDQQIVSENVLSNNNSVNCDIKVTDSTHIGDWDVVVTDNLSKTILLEKALKIV